jgi:hypothetical protein
MVADPALRLDDTPVEKEQVGIEAMAVEQARKIELAGARVDRLGRPVLGRVRVNNPSSQGLARGERVDHREGQAEYLHPVLSSAESYHSSDFHTTGFPFGLRPGRARLGGRSVLFDT